MTKLGQTVTADAVPTKSGVCRVTVNIVVEGSRDGSIAVLRDVADAIARGPRLRGDCVVSPPKEIQDSWRDFVEQTSFEDDACRLTDEGNPHTPRD